MAFLLVIVVCRQILLGFALSSTGGHSVTASAFAFGDIFGY
jgi:hypothetical protein